MNQTEPPSQSSLLNEAERHRLLVEWNATEKELPQVCCIHEVIEEKALEIPDATALICGDEQLTYSELNARANQLATELRRLGVGRETLVGICVERSLEMVIGLLGILKSGGAYVPLDPAYPRERLAFMIEDSKPLVLLTQTTLVNFVPRTKAHILCLDSIEWTLEARTSQQPSHQSPITNHQSPLAYVIYTSGSTGKPKGVMLEHGNVLNFFAAMDALIPGAPTDSADRARTGGTWLAVTSPSFDISVLELFWTLARGFKVVLYVDNKNSSVQSLSPSDGERVGVRGPVENVHGHSIPSLIHRHSVTHLQCTPSMLSMLLLDEQTRTALGHLHTLLIGGEAFPLNLARQLREIFTGTILNMYGPTETTVWSTTWQLPTDVVPARISVGRPIANTQIHILDSNLQPVPIGAEGELFIGGAGVARGYLGRDELTGERFIGNPFPPSTLYPLHSDRLYRTGDRARYLPDGNIEFLGRVDHQVKIRGHRVELGEIEAAFNEHPAVRETVVLFRELPNKEKVLVAYFIPHDGHPPTREELRQFAKQKLPDYMIPAQVMFMTAFPQTPNKKIDRNAFPNPEENVHELEIDSPQAATPVEAALAALWKELLGVQRLDRNDNFFELGGHSMLAMQLVSKVRKHFKIDFPLKNVFERQTLGGMAEIIQAMSWANFAKTPRSGEREVVEL